MQALLQVMFRILIEYFHVLSDGTDIKHYDKAENKMILFDARVDLKSKTLIVHGFLSGNVSIFIQSWDKNEIHCPDPAVSNCLNPSFFSDSSKIIYVEIFQNNYVPDVYDICTSDLKGNDKEILRTIQSDLFRIELKDLTKPDGLLHQIKPGSIVPYFSLLKAMKWLKSTIV
jgi:hypothetical protein